MNTGQHAQFYEEVRADIAELEAKIAELRPVAKYHQDKAGSALRNNIQKTDENQPESAIKDNCYSGMKQADAVIRILSNVKEPLRTREIAQQLIDGGYPSENIARLKTSIFTTMTRKADIFTKAGPGQWKLKKPKEG